MTGRSPPVDGLDGPAALADRENAAVRAAYEADRLKARTPHTAALALRRTANSAGAERHKAVEYFAPALECKAAAVIVLLALPPVVFVV